MPNRPPRDLMILAAAFSFVFMGPAAIQPYMVELVGKREGAIVLGAVYLSFLVFRLLVPWTIQVLSDYWSVIAGMATYVLFAVVVRQTTSMAWLIPMACVWGWGAASMWTATQSQILDATERYGYGKASGFLYMCTLGGQAIGALLLGGVLKEHGARVMLTVAPALGVAGCVIALCAPRRRTAREPYHLGNILKLTVSGKAIVVGAFLFCSSLGYGILLGPVMTQVKDGIGLDRLGWLPVWLAVGIVPFAFYGAKSALSYTGGALSDRLGRERILMYGFFFCAAGLMIGAGWNSIMALVVCSLVLGLQSALVPTASMAMVGDTADPSRRQMALAAVFVWRDLGVVVGVVGGQLLHLRLTNPEQPQMKLSFLAFAMIFVVCGRLCHTLRARMAARF